MAILSSRMESIARKMQNTLFRTARSGVLNTAHDFSCVVLTADCRLLAAAESLPIHVMIGPDLMCRAVLRHHPDLKRGDAFLHNSPYEGNSHAADHCLIVPVIDDDGVPRFFVLAKAHQADCGNALPTTYMGHARDVYEEGALIFPAVKVQEDYRNIEDIIRICRMRIRVPEQWWGDYLAALGAVRIGERELLELGREVGWDALARYAEDWFDYSEQRMIEAIRRLPSGRSRPARRTIRSRACPTASRPRSTVAVDAEQARIAVDLRDNPDCQPCGLNLTEGLRHDRGDGRHLQRHHRPHRAAERRQLPPGRDPGARELLRRHPAPSLQLLGRDHQPRRPGLEPGAVALAELADGFGMAETGPIIPAGMGVISGRDPRHGDAPSSTRSSSPAPAAPARRSPTACCRSSTSAMPACAATTASRSTSCTTRSSSATATWCRTPRAPGGSAARSSAYVEFGPVDGCTHGGALHLRRHDQPGEGRARRAARQRAPGRSSASCDGALTDLPDCHGVTLEPGERIVSYSAGGGGYGPPWRARSGTGQARSRRGLDHAARGRPRSMASCSMPLARSTRRHRAPRRAALAAQS